MTDRYVELDTALERVVVAARDHLAAVKAADGVPDDDAVWQAYVGLNNASHDYDELLNDVFGEVTPWDLETISGDDDRPAGRTMLSPDADEVDEDDEDDDEDEDDEDAEPYPFVVSVRQRRDYRVPNVAALLRLAEDGRPPLETDDLESDEDDPIETVAEAILELLQSGDGSLAMLDVPELDPLDGVVIVADVRQALDALALEGEPTADEDASFRLGAEDRVVGRLNERLLLD